MDHGSPPPGQVPPHVLACPCRLSQTVLFVIWSGLRLVELQLQFTITSPQPRLPPEEGSGHEPNWQIRSPLQAASEVHVVSSSEQPALRRHSNVASANE